MRAERRRAGVSKTERRDMRGRKGVTDPARISVGLSSVGWVREEKEK